MNKATAAAVIVMFVLACVGAYVWVGDSKLVVVPTTAIVATTTSASGQTHAQAKPAPKPAAPGNTQASDGGRAMSVESYITLHISDFAPVKAQLGGTYHVTNVQAHGGAGTVSYEDGHSAYTADFRYSIDEFGVISVDSFIVRKNP